jgi:hypothetical protein
MRKSILVVACLTLASAAVAYAGGQMTLENKIDRSLNLFVDGVYACGPVMPNGGICTTHVKAEVPHTFEARTGMDPSTTVKTRSMGVVEGGSRTWTVCYIDPKTGRCEGQ